MRRWIPLLVGVVIGAGYGTAIAVLGWFAAGAGARLGVLVVVSYALGAAGCLLAVAVWPPRWLLDLANPRLRTLKTALLLATTGRLAADDRLALLTRTLAFVQAERDALEELRRGGAGEVSML